MRNVGYIFNHADIVGGGEISFIDLADAIRKFEVRPVAFVPGPGEVRKRLEDMKIEVLETDWPPIRVLTLLGVRRIQRQLAGRFKDLGLDLVHANGARCMLYAGPAARRAGIPCIWHVRVLKRDPFLDKIRARLASAIIANSSAVAESVADCTGRSADVVYNGLRLDEMASAPALDIRKEFGLHSGPVILAAGRFSPGKGFEDLIRAFALLKEQSVEASLLLVGRALPEESGYAEELRKLVQNLNLNGVSFVEWRDDVPSIMKACSTVVVPSHNEAFGRVIVEAWATGVPVIATCRGGPAELITDGVDGLLFRPGDTRAMANAMSSILRDASLAERLSGTGRTRSREFSMDNHAEKISQIYARILSGVQSE
jgi:glycosyltransferase involved in cell wall biosynthesis